MNTSENHSLKKYTTIFGETFDIFSDENVNAYNYRTKHC